MSKNEMFLRGRFPILYSARFWGWVLFAVISYFVDQGTFSVELGNALLLAVGIPTSVGTLDKIAERIGGK